MNRMVLFLFVHALQVRALRLSKELTNIVSTERYYNLSCPFEWSKFSCAHQGKIPMAEAADLFATPAYGKIKIPNRRVLMIGDSTMRQLFVSVGCSGISSIEKYSVDWAGKYYEWPCQGSINCIQRGEHSGFNTGSIKWADGGEMHFLPHSGALEKGESNILERMINEFDGSQTRVSFGANAEPYVGDKYLDQNDIIIYNAGYHNSYDEHRRHLDMVAEFGKKLNQLSNKAPFLVYITTPTQHFPGPKNGGWAREDNAFHITADTFLHTGTCLQHASDDTRTNAEREVLSNFNEHSKALLVDSIDVHDLGNLHVGEMKGGRSDCTHYCQPGVPDMQAKNLFDQIAHKLKALAQ